MKRYPNGIEGKFFFMKRTPKYKPGWLETCAIEHGSGSVIDFPIVQARSKAGRRGSIRPLFGRSLPAWNQAAALAAG